MASGHDSNDDLYSYDGYNKAVTDLLRNSGARQPRQDSGVDFETTGDAIHNEAVGTLFASQAAADIASTVGPPLTPLHAVNTSTQTQPGPEVSIFARYENHVEQTSKGANQTIDDLREWLEKFKLHQAAHTSDQVVAGIDTEVPPHSLRKRSLSVQNANAIASQVPRFCSAGGSIDNSPNSTIHEPNVADTEVFAVNERLNLLMSDALPMLPPEMTGERDERQHAREEYDCIDRARVIRLDFEERLAQARATNLEVAVNEWADAEEDRRHAETYWSTYEPPSNWPEYVSPGGLESWLEASVIKELHHSEELMIEVYANIKYKDSRNYIIPRHWDMTDRPRRTRLYSNTYYFLKYMWRERRVFCLIEERLGDLRGGQSSQSKSDIVKEMKYLEKTADLRTDAERDYYDLMRDFLNWAIAFTTLEYRDVANGGPKPTRRYALTDDIPNDLVEDVIKDNEEIGLIERYERLRNLEQEYFPERFVLDPWPPKDPPIQTPTQTEAPCTPRGRKIPKRNVLDAIDIGDNDPEPLQLSARLMQTLPRSFSPQNAQFFRVKYRATSVPTLDREMLGEPTSPLKPPETDQLRPPKAKLKLPFRMKHLPGEIRRNTPEPMALSTSGKSTMARPRYNSRTGSYISESLWRRHNPPRNFRSLQRVKRARSFQEPWTQDNIDMAEERSRRKDLNDLYQRQRSADPEIVSNYWQMLRELSLRASLYWVEPTHIGQGRVRNVVSRGSLRIVLPDASKTDPHENFRDMLDADDFNRPEDQSFLDVLGDHDPRIRAESIQSPAEHMQDSDIRVIDFASRANSNNPQDVSGIIDPAYLIKQIEDIDDSHKRQPLPTPREKPVWWASNAEHDSEKTSGVTATETVGPSIESDVKEGVPEDEDDQIGLFQRPLSRLENRIKDRSEVDMTEDESSGSNTDEYFNAPEPDIFHDAPEQSEPIPPVDGSTVEAQASGGLEAKTVGTVTEHVQHDEDGPEAVGRITDDDLSSAQQADPVERPPGRVQQIIERQPSLTPEEIDGYETEEEDLQRQSLSRTRRSTHASRY